MTAMSRIPSLDGLRAISILLVIFGHLANRFAARDSHPFVSSILGNGGLGVEVFFVISGFLITSILLREFEKNGTISLKKFYFRRSMRIFPGFYGYLLGSFVICKLFLTPPRAGDMLAAATYTLDYLTAHRFWSVEHIWSLSVEEQFYILWPTILLLLLWRKGKAAAGVFAATLFAGAPILRLLSARAGSQNLYFMLHTRADALMMGCLIAIWSGVPRFEDIYRRLSPWWPVAAVFTLFVSPLLTYWFGGAYIYVVGMTLECLCIALCILRFTRNPQSIPASLLNLPPMVHVGVLSYSIYLWQELFLHPRNASLSGTLPFSLFLILLAAEASYWCVERPFLQWRERIEARGSSRAADSAEVARAAVRGSETA